jgi:hypothetical protein
MLSGVSTNYYSDPKIATLVAFYAVFLDELFYTFLEWTAKTLFKLRF